MTIQDPIRSFMTPMPQQIDPGATLSEAHKRMRAHVIRHLPVVHAGKLVGIVSMGDLHLIETLKNIDQDVVRVEDAMTPDPFSVGPEEPLLGVVDEMAESKLGCVVVVEGGKVVGLFTTIDALRLLSRYLTKKAPRRRKAKVARA